LKDPDAVALIWALQAESHQPGGLEQVAREVLAAWPERKRAVDGFDETRVVVEYQRGLCPELERLYREAYAAPNATVRETRWDEINRLEMRLEQDPRICKHPSLIHYFEAKCGQELERLYGAAYAAPNATVRETRWDVGAAAMLASEFDLFHEKIARFCLDPAIPVADGWPYCFPALFSTLQERYARQAAAAVASMTHTELSRAVWSELDTALSAGGLSLLTAPGGTGLSHAAQAWRAALPGRAVHFEVPAGNDMTSFFRSLAHSLGDAEGTSHKAIQLKERAAHVLETRQLVLLVDKAKNLFPNNGYRYGFPERLEWLLSDVVGRGVPVVLLADESLWTWLGFIEKRTGWDRGALVNQARVRALPGNLTVADVEAVTRAMLPQAEASARRALAQVAFLPPPLSFHRLRNYARLALDRAGQHGRERVMLEDVQALMPECQASARALSAGLTQANEARDRRSPRPGRNAAWPSRRAATTIVSSADVSLRSAPANEILPVAGEPQPVCRLTAATLHGRRQTELVPG
jgi:hypothetical protein